MFALLPFFLLFSSATAADAGSPASTLRAEDLRVASVGYRLAIRGSPYCPTPHPLTGLLLHHLPEYDEPGRAIQVAAYQLDRGPGVLSVVADSPASRAGLRAGDVVLEVNGRRFADPRAIAGETRETWRAWIEATETMLEEELRRGPVHLRVLRAGMEVPVRLKPLAGCPLRIRLARSRQLNAFSQGGYVILTTRILGLVHDDDELAAIIGHELAHVVLEHERRLDAQGVPTGLFRGFGKNAARIRRSEQEADELGLRLAWAAGYDATAALGFWERLHARRGDGLQLFRTHPSLHARRQALDRFLAEPARAAGPVKVTPDKNPVAPPPGQ